MAEKTRAEMRHELLLLVLGFVFTTLVGTTLTFVYDEFRERAKLREQRRAEATEVFENLSRLMDTRLYRWRQVAWAVEDGKPVPEIVSKYNTYQQALFDWTYTLNRNRSLVCRYFGPEAGTVFEREIITGFNEIQAALRTRLQTNLSTLPTSISRDSLNYIADPLNVSIYLFNNELAEGIRAGDLGSSDPGRECDITYRRRGRLGRE
jgi:hypothetical protein